MIPKPEIVKLIKKHFPYKIYPVPNPGQLAAILFTIDAFLNQGKRHVILEAPTGIGKTLIATVLHNVLRDVKEKWRTTIITATHSLQDQYADGDKSITDLRGRLNYSCPFDKGPYNSGDCRAFCSRQGCSPKVQCPYIVKRNYWSYYAPLRLTNNSFQINVPT